VNTASQSRQWNGRRATYLPIDATGIRLPDADWRLRTPLAAADLRRDGPAEVGSVGRRPVTSAAALAARLADIWAQLRLVEIIPSMHAQIRGDGALRRDHDGGGTPDRLGRAPGAKKCRRITFNDSVASCLRRRSRSSRLDRRPASVDVRNDWSSSCRRGVRTSQNQNN
jgi:hypothetical protein